MKILSANFLKLGGIKRCQLILSSIYIKVELTRCLKLSPLSLKTEIAYWTVDTATY